MRQHTSYLIAMFVMLLAIPLNAQLSPGPLALAHSDFSGLSNCLKCHTVGSKDLTPKCLECHTPIQKRITQKQGFHSQLEDQTCVLCHSDHIGNDFEMIHWDPSQKDFDHSQTGYELEGKHIGLDCRTCHANNFIMAEDILEYAKKYLATDVLKSTFLGLGTNCVDCHEDVHKEEFKEQSCDACHVPQDWLKVTETFDHQKQTKFPLLGAHEKVKCEDCHTEQQPKVGDFQVHRFGGLKFDLCTDCHEDKHKGAFGQDCLECHTESSFKISKQTGSFDHDKTRYPLTGLHNQVKCETCHTEKEQYKLRSSFDACSDCHSDHHEGAFQKARRTSECDQCHSTKGFSPALFGISHHKKTRFPLIGAHLAQPCFVCHIQNTKPIYNWESVACESCHETIHGVQFASYMNSGQGCESCHQASDWTELLFDHQETKFPLRDRHSEIDCGDCHKPQDTIVQYENLNSSCGSCHLDAHQKQFSEKTCDACHSSASWTILNFNHTDHTQFPLDGQHKDVACGKCHKYESEIETIRFKPVAHRCQDCHSFGEFR
jgi:hypothetical protein